MKCPRNTGEYTRLGLAALALALLQPLPAFAQMEFSLDDAESPEQKEEAAKEEFDTSGTDVIDELAGEAPAAESDLSTEPKGEEEAEEIYAVQQIFALRLKRFELATSAAITLNDPYLPHVGANLGLNYWWTNVLAVGVNFVWYDWTFLPRVDPLGSEPLNLFVQRSFRLGVPLSQWQMGAHLNFTYVPFYGKFNMFNKFIFQWDAYVVGGVGFMRTRPIPVFDPEVREFSYGMRAAFNAGIGVRVFFTRWLALYTEFRNYMYLERYENTQVDALRRTDKSTWFADGSTFANNATMHLGLTVFFPFKVEYRLPK